MIAFLTAPESFMDPGWIADFGATNHCTLNASNIQDKAEYSGSEQVYIGDGSGLHIDSIGKSHFALLYLFS